MRELPTGTVTFLFTDIEGSTRLLQELGDAYPDALAEHRRVLREAFARHGGVEVDTQGDAFLVAFSGAGEAVSAAADAQRALDVGPIRVRIGIHTGEPLLTEQGYVGLDVHRGARICATAHGGQIVLSARTQSSLDRDFDLRDLGLHRLKDLTEPERVFQLGGEEFPPLRSLNATNLPTQPTPLIGREREVAEVLDLIRSRRVVTLTGAGGSGKTRLGLQAAAELVDEFKDGVFWVSLAALTDAQLVLPTIATTVGAKDKAAHFVDEKRMLLLLDNLEQILGCAPALAELLRSCPNLRLLVTSRAPLRINGEQEYEVLPLPEADAIELFTQRARQVKPSFEADEHVARICRRLDGLPLAIELAAARIRLLLPRQILDRLGGSLDLLTSGARDLPARQQTLRATIAWSYELLEEEKKKLFGRLAVFAGSFDLEAAQAVCDAELDTLEGLMDSSLLRRTQEARFFLLETIAEYAREFCPAPDEVSELRERHRRFFLALAEAEELRIRGPDGRLALDRLDADHSNLQSAIRTALADGRTDLALRLAGSLHPFWYHRGHFAVARTLIEEALAVPAVVAPDVRIKALGAAAEFAVLNGDYERTRSLLEERLALCKRHDVARLASTLTLLGHLAFHEGDLRASARLYAQALDLEQESPSADSWLDRAVALSNLGWAQLQLGQLDKAEKTLEDGVADALAHGNAVTRCRLLNNLARVAFERGEDERAKMLTRESLELLRELRDEQAVEECFDILACVMARRGEREFAASLAGVRDSLRDALGITSDVQAVPDHGVVAAARRDLGEAWATAWMGGRSMTTRDAVAYVLASLD
jgi:predicted ATPase/class 3 adenylate cyclase